MVLRMRDGGTRSPVTAVESAPTGIVVESLARTISDSRIRPERPLPVSRVQSIPRSLARRAARGEIDGCHGRRLRDGTKEGCTFSSVD